MGSDGGAWAMDPATALHDRLRPAGHRRRPDRHPRGLDPHRRRRVRRRVAGARRQGVGQRLLRPLGRPGQGPQRPDRPRPRRVRSAPAPPSRASPGSSRRSPRSARRAASTPWRWRSTTGSSEIDHVHHAGNSSGIVDGAALVAIGTEEVGDDARPDARGPGSSPPRSRGADPTIMLTGPAPAARKALAKAGLEVDDIDLFEINEAFAAVAMRFMQDLGICHDDHQRQRRRHRDGPPARRHRRDDPRHPHRRARAPRPALRPRHALRRRRHGRRHHRRAASDRPRQDSPHDAPPRPTAPRRPLRPRRRRHRHPDPRRPARPAPTR